MPPPPSPTETRKTDDQKNNIIIERDKKYYIIKNESENSLGDDDILKHTNFGMTLDALNEIGVYFYDEPNANKFEINESNYSVLYS